MLSKEEIERYKRHLVLKQVGGAGQQKLKASKVLVIGAGGLGAPVLMYLAAAGVGTIGIIDDDVVSLDNLQRQVIYKTDDVQKHKVTTAAQAVKAINPNTKVNIYNTRITATNALDIIFDYNIIADGSDNFQTRYLVNDACYFAEKTLVFAALGSFDGHITTIKSYLKDPQGLPNPSYRCIFPDMPEQGTEPNCSETGVLGALAGVMGTIQATEIIKEILGIGEGLVGKLLIYDALSARFETMKYKWNKENPLNGVNPEYKDLSHYQI